MRSKDNACNACIRLDIQLKRDDLLADECTWLMLEKEMHLDAAIEHCRFVTKFVQKYINCIAPEQIGNDKIYGNPSADEIVDIKPKWL